MTSLFGSRGQSPRSKRMRRIFLIAARDYIAAVRTRTFLISLLFLPTLMLLGTLIQWMIRRPVDAQVERYAVVDRTPGQALAPTIAAAAAGARPFAYRG